MPTNHRSTLVAITACLVTATGVLWFAWAAMVAWIILSLITTSFALMAVFAAIPLTLLFCFIGGILICGYALWRNPDRTIGWWSIGLQTVAIGLSILLLNPVPMAVLLVVSTASVITLAIAMGKGLVRGRAASDDRPAA